MSTREHTLSADCWCEPTVEHILSAIPTDAPPPIGSPVQYVSCGDGQVPAGVHAAIVTGGRSERQGLPVVVFVRTGEPDGPPGQVVHRWASTAEAASTYGAYWRLG